MLDNYQNEKDKWVQCVSGGYHYRGISYKTTVYNAFRIEYLWEYSGMQISVRFVTTDGGNGSVDGKVTEITQWHKEIVYVDMTAPGMEALHFVDTYAINGD